VNRKTRVVAGIVIAMVAAWIIITSRASRAGADDEIEYRGQKIKLSKKYSDYDDYKNDPDNIHPSETARVQRLVTEAPIAQTFSSRLELFRATGEIKFPGYGEGSGSSQQPDGSELLAVVIEVPRAGQDRYIVFRGRGDKYGLVDDFVGVEAAYPFSIGQQDGAYVYRARDGKEMFRRPAR
jgi:hypothetical protein